MAAVVDVKVRVFSANDKAYRVFPGSRYRHYDAMRENGVVFIDAPGIRLPAAGQPFPKDDRTRADIARSERMAAAAYRHDAAERLAELAGEDFTRSRWSKRRELTLGWLNGLYHEANIGDLVIVPAPMGAFHDAEGRRTLVGEIIGNPVRWDRNAPEEYRRAGLLVRHVRWLEEIDERELDSRTLRSLRTQNALVSLSAEALRPVLGAAYKNVLVDGVHLARFITERDEFTSRESFHFQAFVLAVVEAYQRLDNGDRTPFQNSIYQIASQIPRADPFVPEQDSNIHSPGYTTLKHAKSVTFAIACLFALAIDANAEPFDAQRRVDVSVVNSADDRYDPCAPDGLEDEVKQIIEIMGYDRWQEMCRAAIAANEDEGFEPISTTR